MMKVSRAVLAGLCFMSGVAVTVAVGQTGYPPLKVLVSSSKSVIGQDLSYPAGTPQITAAIVTMQPNENTGAHRHEAPLFAMVLEGELTVDYGPAGTRRFVKDDAFIEAFQTNHTGTNTGTGPVRILAVFAGSDKVKNTVIADSLNP